MKKGFALTAAFTVAAMTFAVMATTADAQSRKSRNYYGGETYQPNWNYGWSQGSRHADRVAGRVAGPGPSARAGGGLVDGGVGPGGVGRGREHPAGQHVSAVAPGH